MSNITGTFRCFNGHTFYKFAGVTCPDCNHNIDYGAANVGILYAEPRYTIRQMFIMFAIKGIERINVFLHKLL